MSSGETRETHGRGKKFSFDRSHLFFHFHTQQQEPFSLFTFLTPPVITRSIQINYLLSRPEFFSMKGKNKEEMLTKKKEMSRRKREKKKTFLSNKPPQNNLCDQIRQLVVVVLIRRTSVAKVVENGKFSLDISSTVDLGTKIGFTTAWAYNRSGDSRRKVSPASSTSNDGAFRARFLSLLIFGEKEKKRKKDCFFFSFYFTTGLHKISHASSWLPRPLFLYLVRRFFGTPQKKKTVWGRRVGLFSSKRFF